MLKILTAFRIEKKKNRFKSTSIDHLYESNEVFFLNDNVAFGHPSRLLLPLV